MPEDVAVSENLMEQAADAGAQDLRKAEESCSDHLGEEKMRQMGSVGAKGRILASAESARSEFQLNQFPWHSQISKIGLVSGRALSSLKYEQWLG